MDGFFDTMDAPKIILILVTIYFTFDLMVLAVNYVKSEGNTNYKWLKGPFLINNIVSINPLVAIISLIKRGNSPLIFVDI